MPTELFLLVGMQDYGFLSNIEGLDVEPEAKFAEVVKALTDVGFTPAVQNELFLILASILHLGSIEFSAKVSSGLMTYSFFRTSKN